MTQVVTRTLSRGARGSQSFGWWGMVLLVMTESAFFASLLFGYFLLRSMHPDWPPEIPSLHIAGPNTVLLLTSSLTFWLGERSIRAGHAGRLELWLAATLLLGATFLTLQGVEYSHQSFTPATHAYGSMFFTVTGFHGAHVFIGLLMNGFVLARALAGHFSADEHEPVRIAGLYWHFVDAVWIAVFSSLYLFPRLF